MPDHGDEPDAIEMPRPTAAPLILATGIVLVGAGVALSYAMCVVGAVLIALGLRAWIGNFAPGRGHFHEGRSPRKPEAVVPVLGAVEQLHEGMPGYRMRLPLEVQPISAGLKGGIVGGILMAIPAMVWGQLSGHTVWYPVNLLAGIAFPGIEDMPMAELEQFRPGLFAFATAVHAVTSIVLGLAYGVLLPTLPSIRGGQLFWGGVLLPALWTGLCYGLLGVVNPLLRDRLDWPWFVASQFVFGVAAALVVMFSETVQIPPAGAGPDTEPLTS
ncbi:MAG: hypothetical protein U0746_06305 [Gemmataceae bacterium]